MSIEQREPPLFLGEMDIEPSSSSEDSSDSDIFTQTTKLSQDSESDQDLVSSSTDEPALPQENANHFQALKLQVKGIISEQIELAQKKSTLSSNDLFGEPKLLFPGSPITLQQKLISLLAQKVKGRAWSEVQDTLDDNHATIPPHNGLPKTTKTLKSRFNDLAVISSIEFVLCEKSMHSFFFLDYLFVRMPPSR